MMMMMVTMTSALDHVEEVEGEEEQEQAEEEEEEGDDDEEEEDDDDEHHTANHDSPLLGVTFFVLSNRVLAPCACNSFGRGAAIMLKNKTRCTCCNMHTIM